MKHLPEVKASSRLRGAATKPRKSPAKHKPLKIKLPWESEPDGPPPSATRRRAGITTGGGGITHGDAKRVVKAAAKAKPRKSPAKAKPATKAKAKPRTHVDALADIRKASPVPTQTDIVTEFAPVSAETRAAMKRGDAPPRRESGATSRKRFTRKW